MRTSLLLLSLLWAGAVQAAPLAHLAPVVLSQSDEDDDDDDAPVAAPVAAPVKAPVPESGPAAALAEASEEQARAQRARDEVADRQAAEALENYECRTSSLNADNARRITKALEASCLKKRAQGLIERDELEAAGSVLVEARLAGAPTADLEAALASRWAWQARWGSFAAWRQRKENRGVMQLAQLLAKSWRKRAELTDQHQREKAANDAAERSDDVISTPIYPEATGSFMFVKILDRNDGEALFSASDGLFVLRLSEGDSFKAFPGQRVNMTMHSKGERMQMTNGDRLPVFLSGSSPVRTRYIKGFKPNRAKERGLLLQIEAERKRAISALQAAVPQREGTDPWTGSLKARPEAAAWWNSDGDARLLLNDGPVPVYCMSLGTPCNDAREQVSIETVLDAT